MYEVKVITSAVIENNKKFLLGKRSMSEDVFPGLWSIPGGKVESPENKVGILEENCIREVEEEMGCTVRITGYVQSHGDGKNKVYIIFRGEVKKGEPKPLEDTEEVAWFSMEEIEGMKEQLCPRVYEILKNF
ncbi:MAG: NUDIX hydrolase [Candidatus Woesearchaeota archaeon]